MMGMGRSQTHDLSALADTLSDEEFGDPACRWSPPHRVWPTDGREVKLPAT